MTLPLKPRAFIGLGNPGPRFFHTRHNIGFQIIDTLATNHGGQWHSKEKLEATSIELHGHKVLLIKPQTYMNNSGDVVSFLKKQGITPAETVVIHDELELPFGKTAFKMGGSAKGHNGLKSIIERWGTNEFARLRFGIGRPVEKSFVPDYVLQKFENPAEVEQFKDQAVLQLEELYL